MRRVCAFHATHTPRHAHARVRAHYDAHTRARTRAARVRVPACLHTQSAGADRSVAPRISRVLCSGSLRRATADRSTRLRRATRSWTAGSNHSQRRHDAPTSPCARRPWPWPRPCVRATRRGSSPRTAGSARCSRAWRLTTWTDANAEIIFVCGATLAGCHTTTWNATLAHIHMLCHCRRYAYLCAAWQIV